MLIKVLTVAGLLLVGIAVTWAGDLGGEPVAEIEVKTSGSAVSFAPTRCGGISTALAGRLVRRTAGAPALPATDAQFSYAAPDRSITAISIPINDDGRFAESVSVMGSTYTFASSGVSLPANAGRGRLRLTVIAPGCKPSRVLFDAGWEEQDVVLRCKEHQ